MIEEEIKLGVNAVQVKFDYDPPEAGTWNKEPCEAQVYLISVNNIPADWLSDEVQASLVEELLERT